MGQDVLERATVEDPEPLRLLDGALECVAVDHVGEIEQSARHRRAGDLPDGREIGRAKGAGAVGIDAAKTTPALGGHRDIDLRAGIRAQAPVTRRRPMREDRSGAARQHRAHSCAVWRLAPVPDGVDATMNPVQPSGGNAPCDRTSFQARRLELPPRHTPVLAASELG